MSALGTHACALQLSEGHTHFPNRSNPVISCYYGTHNEVGTFQRRIYRRVGSHKNDSYIVLHYLDSEGHYPSKASQRADMQMKLAEAAASSTPAAPPPPPALHLLHSPRLSQLQVPAAPPLPSPISPSRAPAAAEGGAQPAAMLASASGLLPSTAAAMPLPHGAGPPPPKHPWEGGITAPPPAAKQAAPPRAEADAPADSEAHAISRLVDVIVQLATTLRSQSGEGGGSTVGHDAGDAMLSLLQGGARGDSLLHHIASYGLEHLVPKLLHMGCALEAVGQYGRTPLLTAAQWGQARTAAALVRAGANLCAMDDSGMNAAHIAESHGHAALADAFRRCLLAGGGDSCAAMGGHAPPSAAAGASPPKRSKHQELHVEHEHVLQHMEELSLGGDDRDDVLRGGLGDASPGAAHSFGPAEAAALLESVAHHTQSPAGSRDAFSSAELALRLQASLSSHLPALPADTQLTIQAASAPPQTMSLGGGIPVQELLASLSRAPLRERVALHMAIPSPVRGGDGGGAPPPRGTFSSSQSDTATSQEGYSVHGGFSASGHDTCARGGYSPGAAVHTAASEGHSQLLQQAVSLGRADSSGSAAHFGMAPSNGEADVWGESASTSAHTHAGSVFDDVGLSDDEVLGAVEYPPSHTLDGGCSSLQPAARPGGGALGTAEVEVTRSNSVSSDSRSSASGSTGAGGLSRADALRTFQCMNDEEQAAVEEEVELIQRNVRGWLMLRNYRSLKGAVRLLQAAVRRAQTQRRARSQLAHRASNSASEGGGASAGAHFQSEDISRLHRASGAAGDGGSGLDARAEIALRQAKAALVIQNTLRSYLPRGGGTDQRSGVQGGHEGGVGGAVHSPIDTAPEADAVGSSATGGRKRERDG